MHWRAFAGLEARLQNTPPGELHAELGSAAEWATYQRAMLQTARPVAHALAALVPEPRGRGLLLDVGGGHGLYGAAICQRFVPLRAEVLELPEALDAARALAREEGIADLTTHVAVDVRSEGLLPASCDVVLLANVIHHVPPAERGGLLGRAARALRPGGVLAVWDMVAQAEGRVDLVRACFALLFQLSSAGGCLELGALREGLRGSGLVDVQVQPPLSPTHTLITARRR